MCGVVYMYLMCLIHVSAHSVLSGVCNLLCLVIVRDDVALYIYILCL